MFKSSNKEWLAVLGGCLLIAFAILSVPQQTPQILNVNTTVKVEKVPEVQSVSIGFRSEAERDNKEAFRQASEFSNKFAAYLKSIDLSPTEYKTENVSVNKSYEIRKIDSQEDDYYRADVRYRVKIGPNTKATETLSEIIAEAVNLGANDVSSVSFEFLDDKIYENELRLQAAKILRKKAEEIAGLYGTKVGKLATYNEYKSSGAPMYAARVGGAMEMMADSVEPIEINPGAKVVSMEVNAGFELK